ncbi:MAG: hypothetical protein ACE5GO_04070 [Anaerolineales bacterium]
MIDQQKNTQQEPQAPFEGFPFAMMMKKFMSQQGKGCNCAEMMSQMTTMFSETQEQGGTEGVVEEATQEA